MTKLESYHEVWLSVHPERSLAWLKERLRDGFHVHHIDGNHANDDHRNLVLIEAGDHWMIHSGSRKIRRLTGRHGQSNVMLDRGKLAYEMFEPATGWVPVAKALGVPTTTVNVCAKLYAETNNLKWPLGLSVAEIVKLRGPFRRKRRGTVELAEMVK